MELKRDMEDIISQFFNNYDKLKRISEATHSELSKVDIELGEFYHKMEGTHLSHNTQAHSYMLELQDILARRRNLKIGTILVRGFLDNTKPSMDKAKERNTKAIKTHNRVLKEINSKKS